ncbi:MAG TPA: hypothetical protein GX736_03195 [Mogibacterium sp.]|nr:hypothetical protein [Mogibacterium sp.]
MKKKRTLISIFLILMLVCGTMMTAYASENLSESQDIQIATTEEERDAFFEEAMVDILNNLEKENSLRGPKYHYKTVYKPYKYKTLSGYAGNQVQGGYKFPTGGGFWFTDSGGPTVSGSVNIGLPKPYDFISVSINLGKKGSSGLWVKAPSNKYYYKLYVSKVMEMRPYIIYRAPAGTNNWKIYSGGAVPIVYSVTSSAKKV